MLKSLKKLFAKLTRKRVIGALALAFSLWLFTSMNQTYITMIKVPLSIELPKDRAVENPLPEKITIDARGSGWNLFNLIFFNKEKKCDIDLTKANIRDSIYRITRSQIITSIKSSEAIQVSNVYPENIELKTGKIARKKVPLVSALKIKPQKDFVLVGDVEFEPDSVTLIGNKKIISKFNSWYTSDKKITGLNSYYEENIPLIDTLDGIVEVRPEKVTFFANVQQQADLKIIDVPVNIEGGKLPEFYELFPPIVNVTITGGINIIEDITKEDIQVYLDFSDVINNRSGLIKTEVILPEYVKLKGIEPGYINILKSRKINNLKNISEN